MRRLADLQQEALAVMHGYSYQGDGSAVISELADVLRKRLAQPQ